MIGAEIDLNGVSKDYVTARGVRPALKNVTLHVTAGEFVTVVGPTGCGKSTLLRLLAGFETPDTGSIVIGGERVGGPSPERLYAFQRANLFPWLTLSDNVAFALRHGKTGQQITSDELRSRVEEVLEQVELGGAAELYPYQASGGMQSRAALARLLLLDPTLLLMDEPFGALDALTRLRMNDLLVVLRRAKPATVVFVTHDIDEAIRLGDQIVVMNQSPGVVAAQYKGCANTDAADINALKSSLLRDVGFTSTTDEFQ